MKKNIVSILLVFTAITLKAQESDPVLLTIDKKDITLSEFNAIYKKNNTENSNSREAVNEYLDLYINFKLKVQEAEDLGYDTLLAFKQELAGYRKQLAQPYLKDKEVTEGLINEAYDRMKSEVKASHILVMVDSDAYGKDTIEAYNKIIKARERILKGETFEDVAIEVSEDRSVTTNKGDLGYFTVFQMVYPFESQVYDSNIDEVTMPIRTRFGYHLIKVTDKRPARGTIQTAHILIRTTANENEATIVTKEKKINEIYDRLVDGEDFATLAKRFSQDPGTARKGGVLPEFTTGKMILEYEDEAFSLKNDGDISKPFKTRFGYHIVKRISYKPLGSYDELYSSIKMKVAKDSRSNKSVEAMIEKIKLENDFKENINERNDFYKIITKEEMLNGTWDIKKAKKLNKLMFGFYAKDGDKVEYTQSEFAEYLAGHRPRNVEGKDAYNVRTEINKIYDIILKRTAIKFKDDRLPKTNIEFKMLMQEYRDGILLFNLTDEKVWSKAIKDSLGLYNYYEEHKNEHMWGERLEATIYTCGSSEISNKVLKLVKKKSKKGYTDNDILKMINTDSQLNLTIKEGKYERGDDEYIDKAEWENGVISTIKNGNSTVIVLAQKKNDPEPKGLNEVRGVITSKYQDHLEKEWINSLRDKYKVVVNEDVLKLVN